MSVMSARPLPKPAVTTAAVPDTFSICSDSSDSTCSQTVAIDGFGLCCVKLLQTDRDFSQFWKKDRCMLMPNYQFSFESLKFSTWLIHYDFVLAGCQAALLFVTGSQSLSYSLQTVAIDGSGLCCQTAPNR